MSAPDGGPSDDLAARLGASLGHRFTDPGLALEALTHRSFANEQELGAHNERLEFLGDAVLGMIAAEWQFARHPRRPEGELSRAKATLVSAEALAGYAEHIDLGALLRLGVGEGRSGGRRKASLLADTLEAVFGAVYVDGGLEAARRVVRPFLEWAETEHAIDRRDAKTELQERLQAVARALPEYRIVEEAGPDHDKRFVCEVRVDGELLGSGEGRSKKEAQQRAASAALAAARADLPGEPERVDAGDSEK